MSQQILFVILWHCDHCGRDERVERFLETIQDPPPGWTKQNYRGLEDWCNTCSGNDI